MAGGAVKPLTAFRNAYRRYYRDGSHRLGDWGGPHCEQAMRIAGRFGFPAYMRHRWAIQTVLDRAERQAWEAMQ